MNSEIQPILLRIKADEKKTVVCTKRGGRGWEPFISRGRREFREE